MQPQIYSTDSRPLWQVAAEIRRAIPTATPSTGV